jgi:hypothetical protein
MRIGDLFQRDDRKPGKRLRAFGLLGMLSMAALGAIVAMVGDEATANAIWSLLLLLPFLPVFAIPALLPVGLLVGAATGMSLYTARQALMVMRYNWRGVAGGLLLATCALSLIPLARRLMESS